MAAIGVGTILGAGTAGAGAVTGVGMLVSAGAGVATTAMEAIGAGTTLGSIMVGEDITDTHIITTDIITEDTEHKLPIIAVDAMVTTEEPLLEAIIARTLEVKIHVGHTVLMHALL